MNIIRKIALDNILQVLNCPCGSRIPRSGVAGERANCFVVYIENSGKPYLMVESSEGKELKCKEWDGNRFSIDKTINLDEVIDTDLYVIHYYGLNDIEYRGFNEFLKGRILKIVYAKILINRLFEGIGQYFFNKKKLYSHQRIEILRILIKMHLEGRSVSSPILLMTELHSYRSIYHPNKDEVIAKLKLYLSSFVKSGEMVMNDDVYKVTGEALKTIELYEEQERKHRESVIMQRLTAILTVVIILLTAAQTGIIKLPTLIDWT